MFMSNSPNSGSDNAKETKHDRGDKCWAQLSSLPVYGKWLIHVTKFCACLLTYLLAILPRTGRLH